MSNTEVCNKIFITENSQKKNTLMLYITITIGVLGILLYTIGSIRSKRAHKAYKKLVIEKKTLKREIFKEEIKTSKRTDEALNEFQPPPKHKKNETEQDKSDGSGHDKGDLIVEEPAFHFEPRQDVLCTTGKPMEDTKMPPYVVFDRHEIKTVQLDNILIGQKPEPKVRIKPDEFPKIMEEAKGKAAITTKKEEKLVIERGAKKEDKTSTATISTSDTDKIYEGFKVIDSSGKATWKKTHFMFILDCSNKMKGERWNSQVAGYVNCVTKLKKAKDTLISAFTYDSKVNPYCKEKTGDKVSSNISDIPYTGKSRNYRRPLDYALRLIERAMHKDYLIVMLFVISGNGGKCDEQLTKLKELKSKGIKIKLHTIACETDEEEEIKAIAKVLGGDHHKLKKAKECEDIFCKILNL